MINTSTPAYYAGTLQKGDAIVVAYGNRMKLAIFKGFGRQGNPHFYLVNDHTVDYIKGRIQSNRTIYIDFINRPVSRSIAKIDENELEYTERLIFDEVKHLLQQSGKI